MIHFIIYFNYQGTHIAALLFISHIILSESLLSAQLEAYYLWQNH